MDLEDLLRVEPKNGEEAMIQLVALAIFVFLVLEEKERLLRDSYNRLYPYMEN